MDFLKEYIRGLISNGISDFFFQGGFIKDFLINSFEIPKKLC